jgi:hypothetical protein
MEAEDVPHFLIVFEIASRKWNRDMTPLLPV